MATAPMTEHQPLAVGPIDADTRQPLACSRVAVHIRIRELQAQVEVHYEFERPAAMSEVYFPVGELPAGVTDFQIAMDGAFCSGGEMEETIESGHHVRRPLAPLSPPSRPAAPRTPVYHVYPVPSVLSPKKNPGPVAMEVMYACPVHRCKARDTFVLPLGILPTSPHSLSADVKVSEPIRSVSCVNRPCQCFAQIKGGTADVIVLLPESIELEDRSFVMVIERGIPSQPEGPIRLILALVLLIAFSAVSYVALDTRLPHM